MRLLWLRGDAGNGSPLVDRSLISLEPGYGVCVNFVPEHSVVEWLLFGGSCGEWLENLQNFYCFCILYREQFCNSICNRNCEIDSYIFSKIGIACAENCYCFVIFAM